MKAQRSVGHEKKRVTNLRSMAAASVRKFPRTAVVHEWLEVTRA